MQKDQINTALGRACRAARHRVSLGLTPVARVMGCNRKNLSHLELGHNGWSVYRLVKFAEAVGVPPQKLLANALNTTDALPIPPSPSDPGAGPPR